MKFVYFFLGLVLALWLGINLVAPYFDDYCIVGRLSATQAYVLNYETKWAKQQHDADLNDRVIKRECSEFSRRIFRVIW